MGYTRYWTSSVASGSIVGGSIMVAEVLVRSYSHQNAAGPFMSQLLKPQDRPARERDGQAA